jgi:hypothetical protein
VEMSVDAQKRNHDGMTNTRISLIQMFECITIGPYVAFTSPFTE